MSITIKLSTVATVLEMNSIQMKKQTLKDCISELSETKNETLKETLQTAQITLVAIAKSVDKTGLNKEQLEAKKLVELNKADISPISKILVHQLITGTKQQKNELLLDKATITRLTLTKINETDFSLDVTTSRTTLTVESVLSVPMNLARFTTSKELKDGFINLEKPEILLDYTILEKIKDEKLQVEIMNCILNFKALRQANRNFTLAQQQDVLKSKIESSLQLVQDSVSELDRQIFIYEKLVGGNNEN